MATPKIFESEYRFCLILWEREPVSSAELAKICKEKLGWSRTTTYTVIHRLSERGVVKNEGGLVSSLVSKDEAQAAELDALVEKTFEGSLPAFVAAFARKTKLSQSEVDQLRAMIDALAGHYQTPPILYCTRRAWQLYIRDNFDDCDLWIRDVYFTPSDCPWTFWQYTDRAVLDGYSGDEPCIDLNVFSGTPDDFRRYP